MIMQTTQYNAIQLVDGIRSIRYIISNRDDISAAGIDYLLRQVLDQEGGIPTKGADPFIAEVSSSPSRMKIVKKIIKDNYDKTIGEVDPQSASADLYDEMVTWDNLYQYALIPHKDMEQVIHHFQSEMVDEEES